jgi:hypothetical protein
MTELDDLLNRVCANARDWLDRPFGVVVGGAQCDAATDGSLALILDSVTYAMREPGSTKLESLINTLQPPTHTCLMQDLRAWAGTDDGMCKECDGRGWKNRIECERCDGVGEIECDLGHDHECPDCNGDGFIGDKCPACNGRDGRSISGGVVDRVPVNRCLIASVVHDLPGETAQIVAIPRNVVAFHGRGWMLLVSPITSHVFEDFPDLTIQEINPHDGEMT